MVGRVWDCSKGILWCIVLSRACTGNSQTPSEEEWIGMRGDGSLVWAYASGFVPRDSNPETTSRTEVQVWQFDRKDMPKPWKAALITFAETSCDHDV